MHKCIHLFCHTFDFFASFALNFIKLRTDNTMFGAQEFLRAK